MDTSDEKKYETNIVEDEWRNLLESSNLIPQQTSSRIHRSFKGIEKEAQRLSSKQRAKLRRQSIGFVFQFHRLLPEFSALENLLIPQMLAGLPRDEATTRAEQLLAMVQLADRAGHRPGQLSGGEQQRVAIARAVSNAPNILLADEPTGNLDPETAADVFSHLTAIIRNTGTAALIVTHNVELAKKMDRVVTIRQGEILEA